MSVAEQQPDGYWLFAEMTAAVGLQRWRTTCGSQAGSDGSIDSAVRVVGIDVMEELSSSPC